MQLVAQIPLFLVGLFACATTLAGDEFQMPKLRVDTAYTSVNPAYRLIGVENPDHNSLRFWVVADIEVVSTQSVVNKAIIDIFNRLTTEQRKSVAWEIFFYSAVRDKPVFPAFRITDLIAEYDSSRNRVYFHPGSQKAGSWAHGPQAVMADPIAQLVARFPRPLGQGLYGSFAKLEAAATATPGEVTAEVLRKIGFDEGRVAEHRILEIRKVRIPGRLPDLYDAVLMDTDLGRKIVLLQYLNPSIGWWSRVFDPISSDSMPP